MPIKIVSWNVNSIRTRLDHVVDWIDENDPDVLCLQETKVQNEDFPFEPFRERDLNVYVHGQKAYNGVCLISKEPLKDVIFGINGKDIQAQTRVISGTLELKKGEMIRIVNVYMPQGESVDSPKFENKRDHYEQIQSFLRNELKKHPNLLICGDFNVAPDERDVDDVEKRSGKCMFTEEERAWLQGLEEMGLTDAMRLVNEEAGIFSWWDYRNFAWQRKAGMRIDLTYVSKPLAERVVDYEIHMEERGKERPSDHVPVVVVIGN